ncbi:hypothetical protein BASA83_007289 [Batrachochytrium salamandrivorans]|nr:hypothetical protein BASA83_007289 [Batrachochytrium salamandrivorans]
MPEWFIQKKNDLRLSPPATRFNRRLISGTTKRAILTSNTARQAFISAATIATLTQSSATLFEMSGLDSRLLPPNSRVDGRKQWVKHADNLDRAVSRSNRSRIRCCTCHVWKQFP